MLTLLNRSFFGLIFFISCQTAFAQTATFDDIYDMFQVKCVSCHGGTSPQGALDLSGTPQEVYDVLVDVDPVNPAAASLGYKRVRPGYPKSSFMLHKMATEQWDDSYSLSVAEGNAMPPSPLPQLLDKEIELMRQWIQFGAPMNGTVVDPQILEDFYENGLGLPMTTPVDPPAPGEGFQMEFGPIFLAPLEEQEFFKKHVVPNNVNYEVNSLDVKFNDESHHFILYKMGEALAATKPEGLRDSEDSEMSIVENTLVAAWQNPGDYALPNGAAYKMSPNTIYDLNYHIKNYSVSGVLGGKVYVNVYTQPAGTAQEEMYSQIFPISLFDMFQGAPLGSGLEIPADGNEHTFTEHLWIPPVQGLPWPGGTWHIWQLSTHTHARGIDYDIYLADAQANKGEQLYEGFYNFDYTFNQGYYDNEHPAVLIYDELRPVNMGFGGGLIHEATYVNNGDEDLSWGGSVDDEMMLIFVHFTTNALETTSIKDTPDAFNFSIFPNPAAESCYLNYELSENSDVNLSIYDLQGKTRWQNSIKSQGAGLHNYELNVADLQLPTGIYFVECDLGGETVMRKLVVE